MAQSKSFKSLNSDEKLELLYTTLCSESASARKRHQEVTEGFKGLTSRVEKVETHVVEVNKKYDEVHHEVQSLKTTINGLQQATYSCDIIIRGVPEVEKDNDDLLSIVQLLLQKIECAVPRTVIEVRRIGKANQVGDGQKYRPILIQLNSKQEKTTILAAKKKIQISCDKLNFKGEPLGNERQKIYFDEHLTKFTSDLFYNARLLRKRQVIKYAWIRSGNLFVKKSEGSSAVLVVDQQQLDRLAGKRRRSSTIEEENEGGDHDESSKQKADVTKNDVQPPKRICDGDLQNTKRVTRTNRQTTVQ